MSGRWTRGDVVQLAALAAVAGALAVVLARPPDTGPGPALEYSVEQACWTARRFVPALGREITIEVNPFDYGTPVSPRQAAVLASLDQLPADFQERIDDAADAYRRQFEADVDPDAREPGEITRANIREHYRLTTLVVPKLSRHSRNCFFLCGECDWDDEHGIELVVRDGVAVSCGANECLYMANDWEDAVNPGWGHKLMRRLLP